MNKNSLNKQDPQICALASALATEDTHLLPATVVKYGKEILECGSVSYKELSQHFQNQGFDTEMISSGIDMLQTNGIIDKYEFGSIDRIRFTPDMIELMREYNPDLKAANNETKENDMDKGNRQDATNQGSIQKASDQTGNKDQNKTTRSKFEEHVEKISTKENMELAKNVVGGEVSSMDEEVNLVRAIYDQNAQGVNFDTISNKFDVRGDRASLFMALSKDLQQRGVIDKIPASNGDLYVVTMPFRQLMENVKQGDKQGSSEQQPRGQQDRRDEGGTNERRTGQAADQYRQETGRELNKDMVDSRGTASAMMQGDTTGRSNTPGQSDSQGRSTVDTPMSLRDNQRSGNDGKISQGQTGSSGEDTARGKLMESTDLGDDFQPDPAVLSVSIAVFGQSLNVDDVRTIAQAANDFLAYAERNPGVKPTFESHGIVFGTERAQQFLRNAKFYGLDV
jgi:hypothetical protein